MAYVRYGGPRPELVPAFPMTVGDILAVPTVEDGQVVERLELVGPKSKYTGKVRLVQPYAPVLVADVWIRVPALFAFGLAMIRRRPSPWFQVKLEPGEYAAITPRVGGAARTVRCVCTWNDDSDDEEPKPVDPDPDCHRCGGRGTMRNPIPYRDQVRELLLWKPSQIAELYAAENKPLIVNGDVVYAPPGWRPLNAPPGWRA